MHIFTIRQEDYGYTRLVHTHESNNLQSPKDIKWVRDWYLGGV